MKIQNIASVISGVDESPNQWHQVHIITGVPTPLPLPKEKPNSEHGEQLYWLRLENTGKDINISVKVIERESKSGRVLGIYGRNRLFSAELDTWKKRDKRWWRIVHSLHFHWVVPSLLCHLNLQVNFYSYAMLSRIFQAQTTLFDVTFNFWHKYPTSMERCPKYEMF